jgi:hypothetical protein
MRLAAIVVQNLIRLIGVCLLILGFMFWARRGYQYVPVHVGLGIALVVLLWVLSVIGFTARVKPGLVLAGLLWGLLVLWLGMTMRSGRLATVFPGHAYEAVRVLHFLVGLGAIGVAESLGKRIKLSAARS